MTFGDSIRTCFQKYVTWQGRASRSEYWYFWLFSVLVEFGGLLIVGVVAQISEVVGILAGCILMLGILALFLPSLSVLVRRLHDTNRSGWWYWIAFIPFGGIVLLVFLCTEGTQGDNKFGPDPLRPLSNVFN